MKIQDFIFLIVIMCLLGFRLKPSIFAFLGIACLILAIPLFSMWIFFTAQRLIYYSAGFIFIGTVVLLKRSK